MGLIFGMTLFCLLAWEYNHKDTAYDGLNKFIQGVYSDAFYSAAGTNKILQADIATKGYIDAYGVVRTSGDQTVAGTKTFSSAIAGSVTGNAGTVTVANEASDTTCFPLFATAATGSLGAKTNTGLTWDSNLGAFGIATASSSVPRGSVLDQYGAHTGGGTLTGRKSRNATIGSHTIVQSGDDLFSFRGQGSDGTNFESAGAIFVSSDGVPGDDDMPGRLTFHTTPDGSKALAERMRIDNAGNVGIGITSISARLHLPAGSATAGTAPLKLTSGTLMTNPEAGAIEYDGTNFYCTNSTPTRSAIGTMNNPMTTAGDLIVGGTSGAPARLAKGVDGKTLMMVSGAVAWDTPAGGGDVVAPATTTENKVPFWSAVSKTLSDGYAYATSAIANTFALRDANANITAARFYGEADSPKSDYQLANKKYVDDNAGGLPSQTGNSGKYLTTNGSAASWAAVQGASMAIATYTQDFTINSALNGYLISNAGATSDVKGTFDTRSNLGNAFSCQVVNEVGGGIDSYTKLMLHMDGTNDGTTFTDSSASTHTVTPTNAVTKTAIKKFGTASGYFDGTGDYLTIGQSSDFEFTGDYTIDFWAYLTGSLTDKAVFVMTDSTYYFTVNIDNANDRYRIYLNGVSSSAPTSMTKVFTLNEWFHVAMVRHEGVITIYHNGVSIGTISNANTMGYSNQSFYIAGNGGAGFAGYVDEFRVSKDIARWKSDFIPSSAVYNTFGNLTLTPASGEQLPGTSAVNRLLKSYTKNDSITLRTTDTGIIATGVYPASTSWVDTAP